MPGTKEEYQLTFKPLTLTIYTYPRMSYYMIIKRGKDKVETKKYLMDPNMQSLHQINFQGEALTKLEKFVKGKNGKYEDKALDIIVMSENTSGK